MTTYLLHSTILLSAISVFYWLALRHETWFRLNRWTIITSVLLSITLPLIHIPSDYAKWRKSEAPVSVIAETIIPNENPFTPPILESTPSYKPSTEPEAAHTSEASTNRGLVSSITVGTILTLIYIIGLVVFTIVFLLQLFVLFVSKSNLNSFKTGNYTIVEMVKDKEPFSFLNSIYINPEKYDEETYNHIIEHEKIHIDQSHFLDKIIAEILVIIFWFNPLTWLLAVVSVET